MSAPLTSNPFKIQDARRFGGWRLLSLDSTLKRARCACVHCGAIRLMSVAALVEASSAPCLAHASGILPPRHRRLPFALRRAL